MPGRRLQAIPPLWGGWREEQVGLRINPGESYAESAYRAMIVSSHPIISCASRNLFARVESLRIMPPGSLDYRILTKEPK